MLFRIVNIGFILLVVMVCHARSDDHTSVASAALPSIVAIKTPNSRYDPDRVVGTGFAIDGQIITNRHVVGSNETVAVYLYDGDSVTGRVALADRRVDLAVILISRRLPTLVLATTSPELCEEVLAIGHPYGYTWTATWGRVTALNRSITMPTGEVLSGLIQHDAAINPGNSGGPLLNLKGEVVGVNVAIRDGAAGIAFTINVDTVRSTMIEELNRNR